MIFKMGKTPAAVVMRLEILPQPLSQMWYTDATVPLHIAAGRIVNALVPITGATMDTGIAYEELEVFAALCNR